MKQLKIPYVRGYPKSSVVWSEDTVLELHDSYLTIRIDAVEEVLKDRDDELMGTKERIKKGSATILRSSIMAIETGWSDECECYDFTIYTNYTAWGYNVRTEAEGVELYKSVSEWMVKQSGY